MYIVCFESQSGRDNGLRTVFPYRLIQGAPEREGSAWEPSVEFGNYEATLGDPDKECDKSELRCRIVWKDETVILIVGVREASDWLVLSVRSPARKKPLCTVRRVVR
ncbi:hypothetical protein C1H46_019430 [Malus baccata]|uniref:Uncharacterized protein n=1 Tax=Malus baccata TaxID=106549 RepID=A0A540M954_MALBA|nr:hypothetical protein C1H46_019430 [Malus baccata]